MNARPELLLLTRDRELANRMSAAASAVARVESAESPEELEPRLSTLHSPALFLDLRRPEHERVRREPVGAQRAEVLAGKDREGFDKSVAAVQGLVDACKKIAPDLLGK